MNKVKILIADDHELIRRGMREVLRTERNVIVVGEAMTGLEVLEQVEKLQPDVVIMDLAMPELDGVEATRRIRAISPSTTVLIVSMHDSHAMIRQALDAGAQGYVLKTDLSFNLKAGLREVLSGRSYLSHNVTERLANEYLQQSEPRRDFSTLGLTDRELEIARLLSVGKSSKQIGAELGVSVRTVETHRANIMRKLNVHSVTELLHYALAHKLIAIQEEVSST